MRPQNVLFVSPESNLKTNNEMVAAAGAGNLDPLLGTVPGREVISKLYTTQPDLFIIAGHGNRIATEMSDGLLDPEYIIAAMRKEKTVKVVFFNACESIEQVSMIFRGVGSVRYGIGWAGQIDDAAAGLFGVTFLNTLRLTGKTQNAFDTGLRAVQKFYPDHRLPIMLNGRVQRDRLKIALWVASTGWALSIILAIIDFWHPIFWHAARLIP